ncbi:preprotein translocase subunit SecE [Buchnera aphidicola]|uniref:preprotein translocase subunit SecE n=1 Tax=Buchnera aphidicola TaxID=9 RepID=UPI00346483B7
MKSNINYTKRIPLGKILISINIFFIFILLLNKKYKILSIQSQYADLAIISLIIGTVLSIIAKNFSYLISTFKNTKSEIQNISYPTKTETLHTTFMIIIISSLISVLLWGIDGIIFYTISLITYFKN